MRNLLRALKNESPLVVAREVTWRAYRNWPKMRLKAYARPIACPVTFRNVPYYRPDLKGLTTRSQDLTVAYADELCDGKFPLLSYGTVNLGCRPQWNVDFLSGMEWPHIRLENWDCVLFDGSDVKAPYELSRLQFLPVLGKAHLISGKQEYRTRAIELLSYWIESNPFWFGVNWTLAMEAALRAMSICFLVSLLHPISTHEQPWLDAVTHSLWEHLLYIESHLEFSHLVRSNHYLSNILGLYGLSLFLEGKGMARRRNKYRRLLEAEIRLQTYEDGGDYEASAGYHVLVTQMFTAALFLMRASDTSPSRAFELRIRRMFSFMQALASRAGELPHFGDGDDGRVELLLDDLEQLISPSAQEGNSLRVSNLLGIGACLFGEGIGSAEDARWFGLAAPPSSNSSNTSHDSRGELSLFPDSGVAVLRNQRAELVFLALPNGIKGKGSHTHNDKLSFVLRLDGREVLSDSGTACYTRDPALRNKFRATSAHNTVVIDDAEQNTLHHDPRHVFWIGSEARVTPIEQTYQNGETLLRSSHYGYQSRDVTHTRSLWSRSDHTAIVITDLLSGSTKHHFSVNFQLAPWWHVIELDDKGPEVHCDIEGPGKLQLTFQAPISVSAEAVESYVSTTFGSITPAQKIRIFGEALLPTSLTTRITWID